MGQRKLDFQGEGMTSWTTDERPKPLGRKLTRRGRSRIDVHQGANRAVREKCVLRIAHHPEERKTP